MSLFEKMAEDCILVEHRHTADGAGGFITEWIDGTAFKAAITRDTTIEARTAEKAGVTSVYTVTTTRLVLGYQDVFRRVSDGQVFCVTSDGNDKKTPSVASFQFSQVNAEKWELTS